jgi:hypothetical protein
MKPYLLITAALLPICSFGATISLNLYNTGVNDDGSVAADGTIDQHYTATNGSPVYVIPAYPAWAAPSAASYVAPDTDYGQDYDGGSYTLDYTTTFNLADGYNPATVSITGDWSTDNYGLDILVNGNSTGSVSPDFTNFYSFALSGASGFFVNGVNTIDFQWQNFSGPGGIAVEAISGTADDTPEPATFGLVGLGLGFIGLAGRRLKRS